MKEYINTWLHSNIKSNDEKLLHYTNEACINSNPRITQEKTFAETQFCNIKNRYEVWAVIFKTEGKSFT
jgi:hypothetical protein